MATRVGDRRRRDCPGDGAGACAPLRAARRFGSVLRQRQADVDGPELTALHKTAASSRDRWMREFPGRDLKSLLNVEMVALTAQDRWPDPSVVQGRVALAAASVSDVDTTDVCAGAIRLAAIDEKVVVAHLALGDDVDFSGDCAARGSARRGRPLPGLRPARRGRPLPACGLLAGCGGAGQPSLSRPSLLSL